MIPPCFRSTGPGVFAALLDDQAAHEPDRRPQVERPPGIDAGGRSGARRGLRITSSSGGSASSVPATRRKSKTIDELLARLGALARAIQSLEPLDPRHERERAARSFVAMTSPLQRGIPAASSPTVTNSASGASGVDRRPSSGARRTRSRGPGRCGSPAPDGRRCRARARPTRPAAPRASAIPSSSSRSVAASIEKAVTSPDVDRVGARVHQRDDDARGARRSRPRTASGVGGTLDRALQRERRVASEPHQVGVGHDAEDARRPAPRSGSGGHPRRTSGAGRRRPSCRPARSRRAERHHVGDGRVERPAGRRRPASAGRGRSGCRRPAGVRDQQATRRARRPSWRRPRSRSPTAPPSRAGGARATRPSKVGHRAPVARPVRRRPAHGGACSPP